MKKTLKFILIIVLIYSIPYFSINFFVGKTGIGKYFGFDSSKDNLTENEEKIVLDEEPFMVKNNDVCSFENSSDLSLNNSFVVNVDNEFNIGLDNYLIGVVGKEMPASWDCEALKAQAVAARTYVYKYLKTHSYIENSTLNQVYMSKNEMKEKYGLDYDLYYQKLKNVVLSTQNEVLSYQDKLIDAVYFAKSNGYTQDSSYIWFEKAYLKSVISPYEVNVTTLETYTTYDLDQYIDLINDYFSTDINNPEEIKFVSGDTGLFSSITIQSREVSNDDLRRALSLKSPSFTTEIVDDTVIITNYGNGHLVGMSQYGAYGMSLEGYSYRQILNHYYSNIEIINYKM